MKIMLGHVQHQFKYEPARYGFEIDLRHKSKIKAWLKRTLFNCLDKLGAIETVLPIRKDYVNYSMISIDAEQLIDYLQNHILDIERVFYKRPDRIIVGIDGMRALQLETLKQPMSFGLIQPEWEQYSLDGKGYHYSVAGINIQFIPWFEGVLVVPQMDH